MKKQNKRIFASVLFVLVGSLCFSQGLPPPSPPPAPGFPIDGGIFCSIAMALIYGAKSIISRKK
ncbi:hypothetical protein KFZ70_04975 [Tamlana fucoidanivorans]|uniref:Uncharacterized protein n=1 Tax=Allotamlana fucoidanivorans TaxID=2583814 RepID=A0A5C4STT5_9FLAO|nr:hypothetical protein [Tamlana fucoidanivorans]TNJ47129.1 hypothetical protein FGF67_01000 [Tamlana fucoidanivorans]